MLRFRYLWLETFTRLVLTNQIFAENIPSVVALTPLLVWKRCQITEKESEREREKDEKLLDR